ncbi:MAG: sulfurtransferase TusA family protein [Planctomycetota bacterium JB042]
MKEDPTSSATLRPDAVCDGGDLDCGSGLLLIVARAIAPLPAGAILELRSREPNVLDELPVWCETEGHTIADVRMTSGPTCYLIRKGDGAGRGEADRRIARVRRRGDVWSATPEIGSTAGPLDAFLVALAACLSDAVRRSGPARAHDLDEVDVSLTAAPAGAGEALAIRGEVGLRASLSKDEERALLAEAVAASPLASALATPPRLTVAPAAAR